MLPLLKQPTICHNSDKSIQVCLSILAVVSLRDEEKLIRLKRLQ